MEELRTIWAVVKRFRRKMPWLEPEDLANQVWTEVLKIKRDPANMAHQYLAAVRTTALRTLRQYILCDKTRDLKLPKHRPPSLLYHKWFREIEYVSLDAPGLREDAIDPAYDLDALAAPTPEDRYSNREWKRRLCTHMNQVFDGLGPMGVLAREVLLDDQPSARVAARHGVPVADVYYATRRARLRVAADGRLDQLAWERGWKHKG